VLTLDEAHCEPVQLLGEWISKKKKSNSLRRWQSLSERRFLQSGDEQLVRILRLLPDESFARLKSILQQT
jgi:hypothetical protein